MTRDEYHTYLKTPEWKRTAEIVKALAGYRCRVCNSDGPLEAHHRDYQHAGTAREVLDCLALCERCHGLFHQDNEPQVLSVEETVKRQIHRAIEAKNNTGRRHQ